MSVDFDISNLHDDDTLTVEQVADWLQMTPDWVRAHANKTRRPYLPSVRLGKGRRFIWRRLREWLEELSAVENRK